VAVFFFGGLFFVQYVLTEVQDYSSFMITCCFLMLLAITIKVFFFS